MGRFLNIKSGSLILAGVVLIAGIAMRQVSATVPGTNEAVNVNTSGGAPNNVSDGYSVSQDGRYIAFSSDATNLVSGVSGLSSSHDQVYIRDRYKIQLS